MSYLVDFDSLLLMRIEKEAMKYILLPLKRDPQPKATKPEGKHPLFGTEYLWRRKNNLVVFIVR